MRVLFTGASSFTGTWFVRELARVFRVPPAKIRVVTRHMGGGFGSKFGGGHGSRGHGTLKPSSRGSGRSKAGGSRFGGQRSGGSRPTFGNDRFQGGRRSTSPGQVRLWRRT